MAEPWTIPKTYVVLSRAEHPCCPTEWDYQGPALLEERRWVGNDTKRRHLHGDRDVGRLRWSGRYHPKTSWLTPWSGRGRRSPDLSALGQVDGPAVLRQESVKGDGHRGMRDRVLPFPVHRLQSHDGPGLEGTQAQRHHRVDQDAVPAREPDAPDPRVFRRVFRA